MKEVFLVFILVCNCCGTEFTLQYIGDTFSVNETNARDLCKNKYCVLDSEYLFYAASQNASADPCVDFKEFSMGTFLKYRALHERYKSVGFSPEAERDHNERLRKLLASKIDEKNDPRIFKVLKNFFGKCVKSKNVAKNGTKEVIEYLKSLGGSPILNDVSWDPMDFNLTKIFQQEPSIGILHLLGYSFESSYRDNIDPSFTTTREKTLYYKFKGHSWINCICSEKFYAKISKTYKQYKDMLKELFEFPKHNFTYRRFLEQKIDKAIEGVKILDDEIRKLNSTSDETVLKVKELKNYAPNLNIDWLRTMNDQLVFHQQITEDSEIMFDSLDKLKSMSAAMDKIDKRLLADAFVLKFLYVHRSFFIVYPFDWIDEETTPNTKAEQRWQQCLGFVQYNMGAALGLMLSTSHEIDKGPIIDMAKGAVQDFIAKVKTMKECVLRKEHKQELENRLNKIKYRVGFYSKSKKDKIHAILERHHEELTLKGNESLLQSALEMKNFYKRIMNENEFASNLTVSKLALDRMAKKQKTAYYPRSNILHIPAVHTFYPLYHPDRPRFFNQAILYVDIIATLKSKNALYLNKVLNHNILLFLNNLDELKLAYDSYVSWEANGGKELLLSANRMTNQQLFWLALARVRYTKAKFFITDPGKLKASVYDNTYFYYNYALYDLNNFDIIKDVFHCKNKKLVEPIDECAANSTLLAPFKDIQMLNFKDDSEMFGLRFSKIIN